MDAALKIFFVAAAAVLGIISVIRTILTLTGVMENPLVSNTWMVAIIGILSLVSIPFILKIKSD